MDVYCCIHSASDVSISGSSVLPRPLHSFYAVEQSRSHESPEKEVLVNEWRLFESIKCTCLTFKMWASIYLKLVVLG